MQKMKYTEPGAQIRQTIYGDKWLEVILGWSKAATELFKSEDLFRLELRSYNASGFEIPDLGEGAKKVKCMVFSTSGSVTGVEQFSSVVDVFFGSYPDNGIDLGIFPNLKIIGFEKIKRVEKEIDKLKKLEYISITGYSREDCSDMANLEQLRRLDITQGRLKSLAGLENCRRMQKLSLVLLRSLENIDAVAHFKELTELELSDLPKATGCVEIKNHPKIRRFHIVCSKGIQVDLSGLRDLKQLETLWLNIPAQAIDWTDLFHLPRLRLVGLVKDENLPDDDSLRAGFEQAGKVVRKINHINTRKSPHIQISLQSPCNPPEQVYSEPNARELMRVWRIDNMLEMNIAPQNLSNTPEAWASVLRDMVNQLCDAYQEYLEYNPTETRSRILKVLQTRMKSDP